MNGSPPVGRPLRIAHVVNPVIVPPESDLMVAQPITFATMCAARELARQRAAAAVDLYAVQLQGEVEAVLPEGFVRLPAIGRSVADLQRFSVRRSLPLLGDILDALYGAAVDADFMVYTNVDIALQPCFYWTVARLIERGHDAFAVNRRTIGGGWRESGDIPLMCAEVGQAHKGWDCFVFRRGIYPRFELGQACIGAGWIGRVLLANMACLARNFTVFTDLQLTFHIGNRKSWQSDAFADYTRHNRDECRRILSGFEERLGPLDRRGIPGRFWNLLEGGGR
jgi:hypothetical protein